MTDASQSPSAGRPRRAPPIPAHSKSYRSARSAQGLERADVQWRLCACRRPDADAPREDHWTSPLCTLESRAGRVGSRTVRNPPHSAVSFEPSARRRRVRGHGGTGHRGHLRGDRHLPEAMPAPSRRPSAFRVSSTARASRLSRDHRAPSGIPDSDFRGHARDGHTRSGDATSVI